MLCIGILDDRHSVFLNLYRSIDGFIKSFFILFLCYVNFKRRSDWEKLINFFLISSIILCIYGFLNYLIKANPLDSFIAKTYNSFSAFDEYGSAVPDLELVHLFHTPFIMGIYQAFFCYYFFMNLFLCKGIK